MATKKKAISGKFVAGTYLRLWGGRSIRFFVFGGNRSQGQGLGIWMH
jgi:hypothetical protein